MQVGRVEVRPRLELVEVQHRQASVAQFDRAILSKLLQRSVHRDERHCEKLAKLRLSEREAAPVCLGDAGILSAHELLAEHVGEASDRLAKSVIRDRFAKDRGIDQRLTPQSEPYFRLILRQAAKLV